MKVSHTRNKSGLRFVAMHGAGDSYVENGGNDMSDNEDYTDGGRDKRNRNKERKMNVEGSGEENSNDESDDVEGPIPQHSMQSRRRR